MLNGQTQKRAQNFSESECVLLERLVQKYKHIVECKKTDATSNADKEKCWSDILREFNASSASGERDLKSIKLKHLNIKKSLKKKNAENKINLYKTGGGGPVVISLTPSEEIALATVGPSIEGLPGRYDEVYEVPLLHSPSQALSLSASQIISNDDIFPIAWTSTQALSSASQMTSNDDIFTNVGTSTQILTSANEMTSNEVTEENSSLQSTQAMVVENYDTPLRPAPFAKWNVMELKKRPKRKELIVKENQISDLKKHLAQKENQREVEHLLRVRLLKHDIVKRKLEIKLLRKQLKE